MRINQWFPIGTLFFVSNTPATSIRRCIGDHPKSSVAAAETMPWVHMYGASGRELYRVTVLMQLVIAFFVHNSIIAVIKLIGYV